MKLNRLLVAAAGALVVLLSVFRVAVFWANQAYLDSTSGSWSALAVDLTRGVFYRPAIGPDGYGGTLYFPLHFVLHAALIVAIGDSVRAGQILAAVSVSLLVLGVYFVLRRTGAMPIVAASCAALVLASQTVQEALLSIRGDTLAAALSVWGLGLCVRPGMSKREIVGAAALFVLAFATKVTAVSGFGAALIALALRREFAVASRLLAITVVGFAVVVAGVYFGSHGNAFGQMGSRATSLHLLDLVRAPLSFARLAREVPETLVFIQLGVAAFLAFAMARRLPVAALFFMGTLAVTSVVCVFEGADTNHLVEAHAASILVVAAWVLTRSRADIEFALSALAVAGLAASLSLASGLMNHRSEQRHGTFSQTLALIPDARGPILAENPLVPIAAGERPYVADAFTLRMMRRSDPAVVEPLWNGLREHRFSAVVLERDPHTDRGSEWYRSGFFGEGFIDELERSYREAGRVGERIVYLPVPR
jgi:hypothetical protein